MYIFMCMVCLFWCHGF